PPSPHRITEAPAIRPRIIPGRMDNFKDAIVPKPIRSWDTKPRDGVTLRVSPDSASNQPSARVLLIPPTTAPVILEIQYTVALSEHTGCNSAPCGLACAYDAGALATYPSRAAGLVGTSRARTKRSRCDAPLASPPFVSGPFAAGVPGLEMATAGYFWVDRSPVLFPAGLLF